MRGMKWKTLNHDCHHFIVAGGNREGIKNGWGIQRRVNLGQYTHRIIFQIQAIIVLKLYFSMVLLGRECPFYAQQQPAQKG